MTRPPHLRSWLLSATLVVLAVAAWLVLAPTQIGGETSYVTTSGISMAPRFHTGDLAVGPTRPALQGRETSSPTAARRCTRSSCTASSPSRAIATSSRATTTTSSIPPGRLAPTWSAGCRCASRTAAASSTGCTPPSWPLCSSVAWPRCCSWAPSTSAAAATAAGRPRRALPIAVDRPGRARTHGILGIDAQTDLHRAGRGRRGLPGARRARVRPPRDQAGRRQDAVTPRRSASAITPRRPPGPSTRTAS